LRVAEVTDFANLNIYTRLLQEFEHLERDYFHAFVSRRFRVCTNSKQEDFGRLSSVAQETRLDWSSKFLMSIARLVG
jgi:hypothetical protein